MLKENNVKESQKCLIIVYSYHQKNTAKIANIFSEVLNAEIKTPKEVIPEQLQEYDLIGFGSGIYSGKHYKSLLDLVDRLPRVNKKSGFIFSTSVQGKNHVAKDHLVLRKKLMLKGYTIVGEFSCKGFNTHSFFKYFGGINKGKPDSLDLKNAEEFALSLINR